MACESSCHQRLPPLTEGHDEGDGEAETRGWAELPQDLLLVVLQMLNIAEIIFGAGHVCRSWRRGTREEPELWRHIDMQRSLAKPAPSCVNGRQLRALAHTALLRSAGRCEAFWVKGMVEDDFFPFFRGHA